MYGNQSSNNKCLITIVKDFTKEFDDELTVKSGQTVQFVSKLDRYWYEVYCDGHTGKVPISSCREWNSTEMSSIRLVKPKQAAFVAKYDFVNECVEGDLRFSAWELLIGFERISDDWWHGTRLASIKNSITSLSVKEEHCGIFPQTHVWQLKEDLLPETAFSTIGVQLENLTTDLNESITATTLEPTPLRDTHPQSTEHSFYVKVTKTMKAHLSDEIDLPETGEILLVTNILDKLYYFGRSLDGSRVGMFPRHFVQIEENYEPDRDSSHPDLNSTNSSTSSPVPSSNPPTIPPPSPPPMSIRFGKHLSVDFSGGLNSPQTPTSDTPPSYEAAICCEPVSYGYANHMFSGIDSYGRVLFDFDAQDTNELSLRENQIVRLYRHVEGGWMEGEIDGQIGFFPKSYIDIIVDCEVKAPQADDPSSTSADQNAAHQVMAINYPKNTRARILYDFDPEMEQDLRVRAGDIVVLLQRFTSTDWVEAMDAAGNIGFVHLNFCEVVNSAAETATSQPEAGHLRHYANITSLDDQMKPGPSQEKNVEKAAPSNFQNTALEEFDDSSSTKPHRPAPPAPRRTNIFPTFNQFLLNEKHEIAEFEIGSGPAERSVVSEPQKGKSDQSINNSKRQCVITELIQTERDYCHAMSVCLNVFRTSSVEAERCHVDVEKLFGPMKTVVNVSKNLIKLLDNYASNRPYVDQRVGICFLDLKFEFRDAYKTYCKSHDSTSKMLRFYEADAKSSDFMRRCQSKIQEQTNCFDIASIVIKPVQRILKYPLLLNELIKCTEESHTDWDPLLRALGMITDIAQSINEHKRRQDLIQKYCKNNDTSFSSRLKSLNAHTVKKKGSRIANRIISTLTFSSVHNDETFDAAYHKFNGADRTIKSFVKCIRDYLHSLNEYYVQSLVVANSIMEYYGPKKEVEELRSTHHEIFTRYFADFKFTVERDVIGLLVKLTDKFKGPWILINKRKDKLVDYDASLKSSKSDCILVKNTFEALNQQLIEELPLLTDLSLQVFANCLQTFTTANKNLICRIARIFLTLHQLPFIKNSPFGFYQDIEEAFRVKHNLIFTQMLHDFSLIHSSAFPTANGPQADATSSSLTSTFSRLTIHRSSTGSSSNSWNNSLPTAKISQAANVESDKMVQDAAQRIKLLKKYRQEDLFVVSSAYSPCDVFDLVAQAEDLVGVIKRKDPSGQEHRWYVDRGEMKGFLPRSILVPHQKPAGLLQTQHSKESCSSLVSSHSSDHCPTPTLVPLPAYENVDLLTDHRYDTVPEEEDHHSSLLSFDELDHPVNVETQNSLLEFDPLAPESSRLNISNSSSPKEPNHSGRSSSSPSSRPSILDSVYHAAYPFKAGDSNQLSLEFGQRVLVKQKCDLQGNPEWWLVINSLDKEGYVPANYLRKQ